MDNCNNEKSTVLNVLFESREENICVITKEDRKRIKELIKDKTVVKEIYVKGKIFNIVVK